MYIVVNYAVLYNCIHPGDGLKKRRNMSPFLGLLCHTNYVLCLTDANWYLRYLEQKGELVYVHKTVFIGPLDFSYRRMS